MTAQQNIVVGQPEAAGKKRTLARRQAVIGGFGLIAKHKVPTLQVFLDRSYSAFNTRIGVGKKSDQRDQQQVRIQQFRAV